MSLYEMRAGGWSVAVHNDYRLNGEAWMFWLFTHDCGAWVKGEGRSDEDAIEAATAQARLRNKRLHEERGGHHENCDVLQLAPDMGPSRKPCNCRNTQCLAAPDRMRDELMLARERIDELVEARSTSDSVNLKQITAQAKELVRAQGELIRLKGELGALKHDNAELINSHEAYRIRTDEIGFEHDRFVSAALWLSSPWPLCDIVASLADAADHLLGDHSCDTHGHERVRYAATEARKWLAAYPSFTVNLPPKSQPQDGWNMGSGVIPCGTDGVFCIDCSGTGDPIGCKQPMPWTHAASVSVCGGFYLHGDQQRACTSAAGHTGPCGEEVCSGCGTPIELHDEGPMQHPGGWWYCAECVPRCAGCNVRAPWEHRCYGGDCACDCNRCPSAKCVEEHGPHAPHPHTEPVSSQNCDTRRGRVVATEASMSSSAENPTEKI